MAKETIEIPKEDFDKLLARLDVLEKSQMQGMGLDPKIAARAALPFVMVQFTRHHNVASQPSVVQKGAMIVEGYSVSAFEIVRLRKDEYERINKDYPGLVVAEQDKFVPMQHFTPEQKLNRDSGRMEWKMKPTPIPVKELKELAADRKVG